MLVAIVVAVLALTAKLACAGPADPAGDPGDDELVDSEPDLDTDLDTDLDLDLGRDLDLDDLRELIADGELGGGEDPTEAIDDLERGDALLAAPGDATLAGTVGADEAREAALRGRRSPIGRFDLSMFWRHTDPMISPVRDELWLAGTWRR